MNILLSNDDGYDAPGIKKLASYLKKIAHVTIVAPDRNRSGASNSLSLDRPLTVTEVEKDYYYINGCLLYTSPSPRDVEESRMPSSA